MTFAGKKLQDIYDGGSQALADEEAAGKERLKKASDGHINAHKEKEETSIGKLNEKYGEYEAELRRMMTQSVDRIKEVMDVEVKETERHVQYLCSEMKLVADKLKNSIKDLELSYEANIKYSSSSASDQFEATVEQSQIDLQKEENSASKHLKAHGTFVLNSLQQKLDHCLFEAREDDRQSSGAAMFKNYMQKANGIDTHFSTLTQKMTADLQSNFKTLETAAASAQAELEKDAAGVLENIEQRSTTAELHLKKEFQSTLDEHAQVLNQVLSNITEELGRVHDGTTMQLTEQTRELSTNLIVASGEAQEALKVRCRNMRLEVDKTMEDFTQRLDDRLKQTVSAKENLDAEKNSIFESIHQELAKIRDEYEKRLSELKEESMSRVVTIIRDTESDIMSARDRCGEKMTADAAHVKSELERAISQFLDLLAQKKKDALDEIAKAADNQEQTPEQKAAEAQRLRRSRLRKDETQESTEQ